MPNNDPLDKNVYHNDKLMIDSYNILNFKPLANLCSLTCFYVICWTPRRQKVSRQAGLKSHHGNISVQKLPQISTEHIVKMGEIWGQNQNDKKWLFSIFLHKIHIHHI